MYAAKLSQKQTLSLLPNAADPTTGKIVRLEASPGLYEVRPMVDCVVDDGSVSRDTGYFIAAGQTAHVFIENASLVAASVDGAEGSVTITPLVKVER